MGSFTLTYKFFNEYSILIEWPPKINEAILNDIFCYTEAIKAYDVENEMTIKFAYNSLLVTYKSAINNFEDKVKELKSLYIIKIESANLSRTLWKIPVCYENEFALDLQLMSKSKGIARQEIISLHTKPIYKVYFIGFLPGFLYLGGLNKALHFSRKVTPRLKLKKGTVAIGGKQTGVYPSESPGGWNIIGNSPISFFDSSKKVPCFVKPGDGIKFYSVSLKTYNDIKFLVDSGVYQLESEVLYD